MHSFLVFMISLALGFLAFGVTGSLVPNRYWPANLLIAIAVGLLVLWLIFRWLKPRTSAKEISKTLASVRDVKDQFVSNMYDKDAEYYGIAEEEILNNNVDKGIWAQALVKSGGNEEKRKIVYIKLRAKKIKRDLSQGS